ncbi:MAG TPA: ferritin-like domain-containing protein [Archaeoglobaceae archaeon]|nr:ferritin-like domain-containing protein [Archaeoglobaceae archaeon]
MEVEDILKRALEMEKEAIQEYTKMKENADAETAEMLEFMINEEKNHMRMISERLKETPEKVMGIYTIPSEKEL